MKIRRKRGNLLFVWYDKDLKNAGRKHSYNKNSGLFRGIVIAMRGIVQLAILSGDISEKRKVNRKRT